MPRDSHQCSVCKGEIIAPEKVELTSEFIAWVIACGWQCDVNPTMGFKIFCPVCWKEHQKPKVVEKPKSMMDLF